MPVYTYRGVSEAGKTVRGFVDAESDRGARTKLRREGVFLTELAVTAASAVRRDETPSRRLSVDALRRVGGTDLAIATRQLATLIGAGIPLVEALGALTQQVESAAPPRVSLVGQDQITDQSEIHPLRGQVLRIIPGHPGPVAGADLEAVPGQLLAYVDDADVFNG